MSGNGGVTAVQLHNSPMILHIGEQLQYKGTVTRTVVYSDQTNSAENNTLNYSFIEQQKVLQAAASDPANIDVNSIFTYTVTQDPGIGIIPMSETVDDYLDLVQTEAGQATSEIAKTSIVLANDETANAAGGGPYTQMTTTNWTYTRPRSGLSFPLQPGQTIHIPQSSIQHVNFVELNSAGAPPPNGVNPSYTAAKTQNFDGSFSTQQTDSDGEYDSVIENQDGSGSITVSSAGLTTKTTIGIPVAMGSVYNIPIGKTVTSTGSSSTDYMAVDWYPGQMLPPTPLIYEEETVVGPVTTLPVQCNTALVQPNLFKISLVRSKIDTIDASYSLMTSQSFNSDGIVVCELMQEISRLYNLLNGELYSTTTTQTIKQLAAMN